MAGTATERVPVKHDHFDGRHRLHKIRSFDMVADSTDGSFIQKNTNETGFVIGFDIVFGATQPSSPINVKYLNDDGLDFLGGAGATITESTMIALAPPREVCGSGIIDITGNTINSAQVKVIPHVV